MLNLRGLKLYLFKVYVYNSIVCKCKNIYAEYEYVIKIKQQQQKRISCSCIPKYKGFEVRHLNKYEILFMPCIPSIQSIPISLRIVSRPCNLSQRNLKIEEK